MLERPSHSPEAGKQRRPSAYSAIVAPPSDRSMSLSPFSDAANARRRNSYAATTEATNPDRLRPSPLMSSGATLTSMFYGGSSHFLDPRTAASASFKRRLPPTPLESCPVPPDGNPVQKFGSQSTLTPGEISPRRSSSPRVLPPTPPEAFLSAGGNDPDALALDRRRSGSTRRRLPQASEPPEHLSASSMTPTLRPPPVGALNPEWTTQKCYEVPYSTTLCRTSSARAPRETETRLINSSSSSQPPTTFKDPAQFYQEPNCRVNTKRTTSIDNPPHYRNSSEPLCGQYFDDEELPQANNNHRSHNPMLSPHTAPPSPREHGDGLVGDGLRTHSLKSSPSMAQQPKRKYSSDATSSSIASDVAAIASLSLAKNGSGSMAHLLEQQHILRREFTASASPDSAFSAANHSHHSPSNSSSPSIEHINYAGSGRHPMSRSGSEAEDPATHGLDPSLYMGGATIGSMSPVSANDTNGHAVVATTSAGENTRPKGLGVIHCTLQLFPTRKRLRVSILKVEGLAGELKPELDIQPFCKLSLMPGKKQQQQGVIKRGRDAVFNQEFFFDGITLEEIKTKQVRVEVCHQSAQKLQKDLDIGEVRIPLKDFNSQFQTKKEIRVREELRIPSSKKLGKLTITTCIEKEAKRLTINLIKVEDLPKWGIIGAPDVCIRIRMQQSQGQEVTKSSRVIKNSTSAVYKEAIMFLISTKEADLLRTKITISIHDVGRSVTGNDVIGSVFLGELAMDKSEIEQWKSTTDHWSKEYRGVHALKSSQTPEVYISEAHSDDAGDD